MAVLDIPRLVSLLAALADDSIESLQIMQAEQMANQYYPHLDPSQPALILGLTGPAVTERVGAVLAQAYAAEHQVSLINPTGRTTVPLMRLTDASRSRAGAALFVPAVGAPVSYAALQDIVAHLRSPEGCPWDRELTWAKLRGSLLEETHELLAALDTEDANKVREELGDLLLQIGLQAQIATEEGRFRFGDMVAGIVDKLIRRHPHVFGDTEVSGTADVLANWEAIKAAERQNNGEKRSLLSGVPKGLPALAQAEAYQDRMSRLREEAAPTEPWAALAEASNGADITPEGLGEALFGIVAWARARGLDAESALRATNARYAAEVEHTLAR
jgi:tetrapyrrole methylase family protein/MazG family protein